MKTPEETTRTLTITLIGADEGVGETDAAHTLETLTLTLLLTFDPNPHPKREPDPDPDSNP